MSHDQGHDGADLHPFLQERRMVQAVRSRRRGTLSCSFATRYPTARANDYPLGRERESWYI